MIITVTPNPAFDITYNVPELIPGLNYRVETMIVHAGGKGLNASAVLAKLNIPTLATGFLGGSSGSMMRRLLAENHVPSAFVEVDRPTRRSVSVIDPTNGATVFNELGTPYTPKEWEKLFHLLNKLDGITVATVNGSFPPDTPEETVRRLYQTLLSSGVPVLVDTSGDPLRWAIEEGVDAIKPNQHELIELMGTDNVYASLESLLEHVKLVVASRGAEGMVAQMRGKEPVTAPATTFVVGNPTGAGDSVVASLARSIARDGLNAAKNSHVLRSWLADAIALSAATVAAPVAGDFDQAMYEKLLQASAKQ